MASTLSSELHFKLQFYKSAVCKIINYITTCLHTTANIILMPECIRTGDK